MQLARFQLVKERLTGWYNEHSGGENLSPD